MAAVQQNGGALRHVFSRGVVMAPAQQNGHALAFASTALREDRGVVMAAVQKHADALEFASTALREDRGVGVRRAGCGVYVRT